MKVRIGFIIPLNTRSDITTQNAHNSGDDIFVGKQRRFATASQQKTQIHNFANFRSLSFQRADHT